MTRTTMTWKPVLVGVDASAAAERAAALGWKIAHRARAECRLVHVMPDYTGEPYAVLLPPNFAALHGAVMKETRRELETTLRGVLPGEVAATLELRAGNAGHVLLELAKNAELVVLGGKHHGTLGRWLAGSTAHQVARASEAPVLVAGPSADAPRRVLAAVDLSGAAIPTVHAAAQIATLFGADLRVLHVVESVPPAFAAAGTSYGEMAFGLGGPPVPLMDWETWSRIARETFDQAVWPEVDYRGATPLVMRGDAETEIRRQVAQWQPDLLVVGTHGKSMVDRLLMGSVTHHLLTDLPASLLVVPMPARVGRSSPPVPFSHSREGGPVARVPALPRAVV